jgi:hypothetical protein
LSEAHYYRVALPEGDPGAKVFATREAVSLLLVSMEAANIDPTTGQFRITYDMNSPLTRESVLVEWRPNT